jgi:hypothetical protein
MVQLKEARGLVEETRKQHENCVGAITKSRQKMNVAKTVLNCLCRVGVSSPLHAYKVLFAYSF